MNWRSKLNKKEKAHLKENNVLSTKDLAMAIEHQKGISTPCFDCNSIALKIGIDITTISGKPHWVNGG